MHSRSSWIWQPSWIFRVVGKAGSNGRISLLFGPQIMVGYMYYWATNKQFRVETALLQLLSNLDYKNSFVYWTI